jgi:raffinose/stachyose/melibiose transport system substrate-binding protein
MIHQGNWAEDSIRKTNPTIDIGFLLGPTGNQADKAGIMFDSNQTIRVAKDGKNLKAALAWLKWLTTSEYGKKWIPDKIKQLSPIIGAKASTAELAQATVGLLARKTPSYSWYYQRFPNGTEQGLGIILQGYCAGQTNRQQTLEALDADYTKIVNASK